MKWYCWVGVALVFSTIVALVMSALVHSHSWPVERNDAP